MSDNLNAIFGEMPEYSEEDKARHDAFRRKEQERIIDRLVRIFENNKDLLRENPDLKYFGDAPNHYAEYYLNEEVWNRARERFLSKSAGRA